MALLAREAVEHSVGEAETDTEVEPVVLPLLLLPALPLPGLLLGVTVPLGEMLGLLLPSSTALALPDSVGVGAAEALAKEAEGESVDWGLLEVLLEGENVATKGLDTCAQVCRERGRYRLPLDVPPPALLAV